MIKTFLKDSAFYTITTFISKLSNVLLLPFYISYLSKADFGLFDYVTISLTMLTLIFTLQIDQSFGRYFSTTQNPIKRKSIYSTGLVYYIVVFFFISLIIFFTSEQISTLLFDSKDNACLVLQISCIYIFFNHILIYNLSALRWNDQSRIYMIIASSMTIFQSGIILLFLLYDYAVLSIFIGQSIVSIIFSLITVFLLKENFKITVFSFLILKRLIQFGLPLVPAAISIYMLQYVDRVMIVEKLGLSSLGIYSVGIRISTIIMLLFSGFQMAWGPFIFSNYTNQEIHPIISNTFKTLIIFTLIITVSVTLFTPEFIYLIGNSDYEKAYIYVPYLIFTSFLFLISGYFSIGFSIAKKNWPKVYINLSCFLLNVILNYLLIQYLNIEGAALATLLSFIVLTIVSLRVSNRYYPIQFRIQQLIPIIVLSIIIIGMSRYFFAEQVSLFNIIVKSLSTLVLLAVIYLSKLISVQKFIHLLKKS